MTGIPAVLDLPQPHHHALATLLRLIPPGEFPWVLTGSASLRLQGVQVEIHDLDIQSDEKTILLIEKKLAPWMVTPVHIWESPGMRSLDGKAMLEGIQFELLANLAHLGQDGQWSSYTDFSCRLWVEYDQLQVPVFPLEDEYQAYQAMGRTAKVALIRAELSRREKDA